MTTKSISKLQVGIALIFAGIILLAANIMKGSEYSNTIMFIIIALWFVPYSYLQKKSRMNRKTNSC